MSGRNQYTGRIPNIETAHNQSHSKMIHSNNSPLPFTKQKHFKIKSIASREFDAYESYYGVNNSEDYATRKERYLADDYLFKRRLKCQPMSKSKNKEQKCIKTIKPVQCFASRSYSNSAQHRTSTPIKNIFIRGADNKTKEKVEIPNDVPMDWDNYHRLDVIHKFMGDLELDYPSLCTTGSIGKSLEGRDLKVLKISNSDSSNVGVWIDAGIHAREWIAPAVNTYVADHIA